MKHFHWHLYKEDQTVTWEKKLFHHPAWLSNLTKQQKQRIFCGIGLELYFARQIASRPMDRWTVKAAHLLRSSDCDSDGDCDRERSRNRPREFEWDWSLLSRPWSGSRLHLQPMKKHCTWATGKDLRSPITKEIQLSLTRSPPKQMRELIVSVKLNTE